MSDIKWIEGEIPKPGTCVSCGSADHGGRKFLTFSKFIRNYGKVLLCDQCVGAVVRLPGLEMVPRIELEMSKTEARVYRDQLEPALDALRNIRGEFSATCDRFLNADGSPKDQTIALLKPRRVRPIADIGNKTSNTGGSGGFFDDDPGPAA